MFQNPFDDGLDIAGVQGVPIETFSRFGEFALVKRLHPGQVVLDLGANIGYFTLLFARQVGDSGHVYAFEPGPLSFLLLKKNIAANAYRNITPINKAVSDKSETIAAAVPATIFLIAAVYSWLLGAPSAFYLLTSLSLYLFGMILLLFAILTQQNVATHHEPWRIRSDFKRLRESRDVPEVKSRWPE